MILPSVADRTHAQAPGATRGAEASHHHRRSRRRDRIARAAWGESPCRADEAGIPHVWLDNHGSISGPRSRKTSPTAAASLGRHGEGQAHSARPTVGRPNVATPLPASHRNPCAGCDNSLRTDDVPLGGSPPGVRHRRLGPAVDEATISTDGMRSRTARPADSASQGAPYDQLRSAADRSPPGRQGGHVRESGAPGSHVVDRSGRPHGESRTLARAIKTGYAHMRNARTGSSPRPATISPGRTSAERVTSTRPPEIVILARCHAHLHEAPGSRPAPVAT